MKYTVYENTSIFGARQCTIKWTETDVENNVFNSLYLINYRKHYFQHQFQLSRDDVSVTIMKIVKAMVILRVGIVKNPHSQQMKILIKLHQTL